MRIGHDVLWLSAGLIQFALAQFPTFNQSGATVIQSPVDRNIQVSYRSPPFGTCTTVFETQKQFTGYVHLPPNVLAPTQGNYSINTFFWFIEARQTPELAPLSIFINGGPGSSSMVGLFQEVGPCKVVEVDENNLGTIAREWGWDRSSNILFIDQPVQVGFSYDSLSNMSLDLLTEIKHSPPTKAPISQPAYTFLNGTFASGNKASTANTTDLAAQSTWHFLQAFLSVFPEYNPDTRRAGTLNGTIGVNLFTESYGGKYGPAMFAFFQQQNNLRRTNKDFAANTLEVRLESLGIMNGWVDLLIQAPYYPRFAYNNTYNIQAISQTQELNALNAWQGPGGCQQQANACRSQQAQLDQFNIGNVPSVDVVCSQAQTCCQNNLMGSYILSNRSVYDISQNALDPFPDTLYLDYLNQADVQQAIGVPVNFTQSSTTVAEAFASTGDYVRDGILADLVVLLNAGVHVALIYGDRDYICNWLGGEAVSFAVAGAAGSPYAPWYSAGYAPIVTNNSYIGGVVREYGNLTFARIYDAGHLIPAYEAATETAFTVFSRIVQGTGVSLGKLINRANYTTTGDRNATHTNSAPAMADATCHLRAINSTCDTDQKNMIANAAGTIINGVLYTEGSQWSTPAASISSFVGMATMHPLSVYTTLPYDSSSSNANMSTSSGRGKEATTASVPTGVFTATGIPHISSGNAAGPTGFVRGDTRVLRDTPSVFVLVMELLSYGLAFCA